MNHFGFLFRASTQMPCQNLVLELLVPYMLWYFECFKRIPVTPSVTLMRDLTTLWTFWPDYTDGMPSWNYLVQLISSRYINSFHGSKEFIMAWVSWNSGHLNLKLKVGCSVPLLPHNQVCWCKGDLHQQPWSWLGTLNGSFISMKMAF